MLMKANQIGLIIAVQYRQQEVDTSVPNLVVDIAAAMHSEDNGFGLGVYTRQ